MKLPGCYFCCQHVFDSACREPRLRTLQARRNRRPADSLGLAEALRSACEVYSE